MPIGFTAYLIDPKEDLGHDYKAIKTNITYNYIECKNCKKSIVVKSINNKYYYHGTFDTIEKAKEYIKKYHCASFLANNIL